MLFTLEVPFESRNIKIPQHSLSNSDAVELAVYDVTPCSIPAAFARCQLPPPLKVAFLL